MYLFLTDKELLLLTLTKEIVCLYNIVVQEVRFVLVIYFQAKTQEV